jgi:hypothetical protein
MDDAHRASLSYVFDLGPATDLIWGIIGVAGAVAAIGALVWVAAKGHADRHAEDAAREFFDSHGHWPDEDRATTP